MSLPDFISVINDKVTFYDVMGWVAVCFYVSSFQCLYPKKTVLFWIPANSFMAVHYYGLNSYTACALALGAIFRDIGAVFGSKKVAIGSVVIFTIYIWIMACVLSTHLHDYLITLGTTFTGFAVLSRDYFWRQRFFSLIQQVILFLGFYLLGSLPAMTFICMTFLSNIIGMARKLRKIA